MKSTAVAAILLSASPAMAQADPETKAMLEKHSFDEQFLAFASVLNAAHGMAFSTRAVSELGAANGQGTPVCILATQERDFYQRAVDLALVLPPIAADSTINPKIVATQLKDAPLYLDLAKKAWNKACAAR